MEELKNMLQNSGFVDVRIDSKENSDDIIRSWNFGDGVEQMVFSAYITAFKPV